jgi:hypothetical protein
VDHAAAELLRKRLFIMGKHGSPEVLAMPLVDAKGHHDGAHFRAGAHHATWRSA